MKTFIVAAISVATQAVDICKADEKTIIGFVYDGTEMNDAWEKLS